MIGLNRQLPSRFHQAHQSKHRAMHRAGPTSNAMPHPRPDMRALASTSDLPSSPADDDLRDLLGDMYESTESRGRVYVGAYMAISAFSGLTGWYLHRPVLDIASTFMSLSSTSNNFETSFFSLLSFVYGLFSGQTFLFLYERQVDILQELYSEIFALENLIQLTFVSCPDVELRSRMADSLQRYVRSEVYDPSDMTSPFDEKGPYMEILDTISLASDQSVVVTDLVEAAKHLADAQSRRSAVASQILPDVHYLFMLVQVMAIIISFLVFDYTEINGGGEEERRLLFGALISFLTLTSIVLWDLSDPLHGLYSFRGNLDKRIGLLAKAFKALKSQDAAFIPKPVETLRKLGIVSFPSAGGSSKVTKKQRLPF